MAEPGPETEDSGETRAQEIVAQVESGPRNPEFWLSRLTIMLLCIAWSGYQLYIAYQPIDATIARAWHLAFAILLVFLAYPAFNETRPPFWVKLWRRLLPRRRRKRSLRGYIPLFDVALGVIAAAAALYIWWDYEGIIMRQGLPSQADVWIGVVMIILLLEAARRALG
ncbi:MAG: TRAP transporter permease, partial [Rhodospirillaceae bacterium]|nr:TRAP transporter permease [Rhodospirillaceae bacterium]